jgi:transcription-repair coupling factor (superfamily II helicase)
MRDLEIRGSGNLLGAAQSGFIGAVGFETYVQLLADAVGERKGALRTREDAREAVIDVKLDAYIPDDYIPQVSQKIAIYQQLAAARTIPDVEEAVSSVRDRFGALPPQFDALVEITRLRVMALQAGVTRVVINEQRLTLGVGSAFRLDPATIPKLQSLTKNRFRFGEGKITIDLPARSAAEQLPTLHALLEAL